MLRIKNFFFDKECKLVKLFNIECLLIGVLFFTLNNYAQQKHIDNQKLVWYGYFNTLLFNENWKLNSEIQERHFVHPVAQHQLVFRTNIERKIVNNSSALLGMTLFLQSPNDPYSASNLMVPELRPSIGFTNFDRFGLLKMNHRYQLEARFYHNTMNDDLTSGYTFSNFRFRYQLGFDYPIIKIENSDKLVLKLKDEVMLNIGNQIVRNTFDQNRIYLGINFNVNSKFALEAGYLNWYQQQTNGTSYYNRDILRLSIFHTLSIK
jgi:hypothetical protein